MCFGRDDDQPAHVAAREPLPDLAAHTAAHCDEEPRRRLIGAMPWAKARQPSRHAAAIRGPFVAKALHEIFVLVPSGETGGIDMGPHAGGGEPRSARHEAD